MWILLCCILANKMSWLKRLTRPGFRSYTLMLVALYLFLVFAFHSNLDPNYYGNGRSLEADSNDAAIDSEKLELGSLAPKRLEGYDVIEGKADRPEVRIDPDSRAARYLREYGAKYVNPPVEHEFKRVNQRVMPSPSDELCFGTPMAETNTFTSVVPDLYVYSVFWDARYNDFDNTDAGVRLRIMTVIRTSLARSKPPIYCIFRNATHDWVPIKATFYEMCENHGRPYGGFILSCEVPQHIYGANKNISICSVRLTSNDLPSTGTAVHTFKVINTVAREKRHDFAICVAPLYGQLSHNQLIEFIELSSILGSSHVTFYDFNISPDTLSLLEYYASIERVTIVPWRLSDYLDRSIWYHGQLVSILDCLYRNMALTKYLAFNDIDEYMMPYEHVDWNAMMTSLDSDNNCGYQFNSVFVDPNKQAAVYDGPMTHKHLLTLTNTQRTVSRSKIRTKCMLKPQLVFEAGIHHISKPIVAHLQTVRMDMPQALLHHHRVCQPNFGMNCQDFIDDRVVPSRYADVLIERVNQTKHLFLADSAPLENH